MDAEDGDACLDLETLTGCYIRLVAQNSKGTSLLPPKRLSIANAKTYWLVYVLICSQAMQDSQVFPSSDNVVCYLYHLPWSHRLTVSAHAKT